MLKARKAHELRGAAFGVSKRPNYTTLQIDHLDELPTTIVPKVTEVPRLPFKNLNGPGFKYDLLMVEPPILMSKLQSDLDAAGIVFIKRKFQNATELTALKESIIVNCTGLGAGKLFNDEEMMVPIKGQLVLLKAQPNLKYLFSGKGYVFPRTDAVIVGGSKEPGVDNDKPDPVKCKDMVTLMKGAFDGAPSLADDALPDWLILGK